MAVLPLGMRFEHPSASSAKPHILSYATARSLADDGLLEVWNGATSAARVLRVNKDGQVQLQDGAVGAPALAPEDDKTTGVYFVAGTPEVAVAIAGSKVLSVVAAGVAVTGTLSATGGYDGTVGATTPAAGTFTTLNATGGGALTGTWTDLGSVTTVDINGGTIDGVTIGGAAAGAGTFTTLTASTTLALAGASVTGTPTWSSNQAITLSTAAQPNVTSLGTLTSLQVDNLNVNGNTLSATTGALNLTPAAGSAIVLDGTINVDAGVVTGATSITSTAFVGTLSTAAQPNITSVGTLDDLFLASGGVVNFASGDMTITHATNKLTFGGGDVVLGGSGAQVFLNDTANANQSTGLTIKDQTTDEAVALKGTAVSHGHTSITEADTFMFLGRYSATGAAKIVAAENSTVGGKTAIRVEAYGSIPDATAAIGSEAAIQLYAPKTSSSSHAANTLLFGVSTYDSGERLKFAVDHEGDFHYDGADGGAFDAEDDVALVRAFALATASKDVIRTEFDRFVRYNEDDLVRLGLLGDTIENGGLVNGAQVQRLLVGAVWQQQVEIEGLRSQLKELTA